MASVPASQIFTSKVDSVDFWLQRNLHDQFCRCLELHPSSQLQAPRRAADLLSSTPFTATVRWDDQYRPRRFRSCCSWNKPSSRTRAGVKCEECEMRNVQSIPSSGKHACMGPGGANCSGAHCWLPALHMGLYNKVVTYFFLYRWVALSTITPSLIESA